MRARWMLPLISACLVALAPAAAETIRLGKGREVKGKVVKETGETVFVDLGYTIIPIPKKEIVSRQADEAPASGKKGGEAAVHAGKALFSSIDREEASVKENVERTASAVVMIRTPTGLGSGFIITSDGYVVTNDHVIQGDTKISIVLFGEGKDGALKKTNVDKVKIVSTNAYVDLALLKLEGYENLPIAYLGDSDAMKVGQPVYAIGNPLGLERSVSEGIISTTNRPLGGQTFIQTTAAINPGNSGGPLFNLRGEVIGVANLILRQTEGLNFAIPSTAVKRFLKDRDAFTYDKDNPNTGYRYLPAPPKSATPETKK
jgi:serine protease Do